MVFINISLYLRSWDILIFHERPGLTFGGGGMADGGDIQALCRCTIVQSWRELLYFILSTYLHILFSFFLHLTTV
jgi:hypothetical protein